MFARMKKSDIIKVVKMNKDLLEEILLEHHKEYVRDKENLKYAKAGAEEIFSSKELERLQEERNLLHSGRGKDSWHSTDDGSGIRTISERIKKTFIEEGEINIIGAEIKGLEDLAALLQIYKNPNFETFRLIYMKGNKIVGIEGASCRLPSVCPIHEHSITDREYVDRVLSRMQVLGADGYYMTHNHPSGDVTPSFEDKTLTHRFETGIPGFKGHIITDHTVFTHLTKSTEEVLNIPDKYQLDLFEHKEGNTDLLTIKIEKSEDVANIARLLDIGKGTSLIIHASVKGSVEKVDEVPNNLLKSEAFNKYLINQLIDNSSSQLFCLTDEEEILAEMSDYVSKKQLVDCVYVYDEDYVDARSFIDQTNEDVIAGKSITEIPVFSFFEKTPSDREIWTDLQNIKQLSNIRYIADIIVRQGCKETNTKNWMSTYEDISQYVDRDTYLNNLKLIESELNMRNEIVDVQLVNDQFDIIYDTKYCRNIIEEEPKQPAFIRTTETEGVDLFTDRSRERETYQKDI